MTLEGDKSSGKDKIKAISFLKKAKLLYPKGEN